MKKKKITCILYIAENSSESESLELSEFSSDSESDSTLVSDASQTNTTVCSIATADYQYTNKNRKPERENKEKRIKVKVVTKANQSTVTDKADVCDVSTVTYDWWSPIVEKKIEKCKKDLTLDKKEADLIIVKEKRRLKNGGIVTGRVVAFKSRAQIIPSSKKISNIPYTENLQI